jgi:PAS domain S-box-containing protein
MDTPNSAALLLALVEGSNDGMAAVSGDSVLFANTRLRELLGRTHEEMDGAPWVEWFAPEHRERLAAGHAARMAGESPGERFEAELVHTSGRLVPVEVTLRPHGAGAERATLAVIGDLTGRRRGEWARRQSEARLRSIVDQAAMGIAVTDLTGRHLDANAALLRMLGMTLEEFRATKAEDFTHPDALNPDHTLWRELEAGLRASYQRETRYVHRDGADLWVRLTVSFMRDPEGRPEAIVAMVEDISEAKGAQAAKEALAGELRAAHHQVKVLSGLLPICSYCKQIRDDQGYWHEVEAYIHEHSDAKFSHGICPTCFARVRDDFGV